MEAYLGRMIVRRPRGALAIAPGLAAATVGLLAACQARTPATVAAPVPETAPPHFALAHDMITFAANGDLARLRTTAQELATEEPGEDMPAGAEPSLEEMRQAFRRAAEASEPAAAAHAVAQVAASCGACHLANAGTLGDRPPVPSPALISPATRHTSYLAWVSRLLWDGLAGPSESSWRTGAGALVGAGAFPPPYAEYVPADEVARAAALLQDLGVEAVVAPDADARADVLGRIWTACADCHVQAGIR